MRINEEIKKALMQAIEKAGNQELLSAKCGVSQKCLSTYLNNSVKTISYENWIKLRPFLIHYLPLNYYDYIRDNNEEHLLGAFRHLTEKNKEIIITITMMLADKDIDLRYAMSDNKKKG